LNKHGEGYRARAATVPDFGHLISTSSADDTSVRAWDGAPRGQGNKFREACIRCPVLRVDPRQRGRLIEIIDSLNERIKEARMNGWLGEVQGLQTSLDAAAKKIVTLDRSMKHGRGSIAGGETPPT
jgi:hypothetical protein